MGYDVVRSYKLLILSETTFQSAQEYFDELVLQQYTDNIVLLCGLDNAFDS